VIVLIGIQAACRLSLDVTPDISNLQVQVLTPVPNLSPEEIESSVTRPIELEMFGLPGLEQVRSLTRFGISQVRLIFSDGTDLYRARQMVTERLAQAMDKLPRGLSPRLAPPSSGLGEVFTYALVLKTNRLQAASATEATLRRLKLANEFIIKPCLKSARGIAEVNTTGGYDQQMVVEVDPSRLSPLGVDLNDIAGIVEKNAAIGGGALVERDGRQFIIRSRSRSQTVSELTNLCIKLSWGSETIPLSRVATVSLGSNIRLGAATLNGQEAVLGTAMMLDGENARAVARSFRLALAEAQTRLPPDMQLRPLYDRAKLVDGVIDTVGRNLVMAGGLVLAVLLLFLRSWRAALIVTLLLLLSFALGLGGMATFGIMGSLLTLGAMDFGVVVDDSIVMVENVARKLAAATGPPDSLRSAGMGEALPAAAAMNPRVEDKFAAAYQAEAAAAGPADTAALQFKTQTAARLNIIIEACCQVRKPMLVGMLVIIGAYVPILTLGGVEGRMFRPLAQAVILVLLSSLALTLTLVPALCAIGLRSGHAMRAPRFMTILQSAYELLFRACRRFRWLFLALAVVLAAGAGFVSARLGANFLPYLDEGWLVVEVQRDPQISLAKSLEMELQTERAIRAEVPEAKDLFSRIGMSQIATDPQGANQNDIYISFRPRSEWRKNNGRTVSKSELGQIIRSVIKRSVPAQELELSQPIAVRFDEMLEGVRTDLAIKLFGPDYVQLDLLAAKVAEIVGHLPDAGAVVIDQSGRAETMEFQPNRALMLRYMATGDQVNNAVAIGLAGRDVGRIDEGDWFYPLVVRTAESSRTNPDTLNILPLRVANGSLVLGLGNLGKWEPKPSVAAITREQAVRREAIMVTVENADVVGFVARTQEAMQKQIQLPDGYRVEVSGAFQNWESGSHRLMASGGTFIFLSLMLVYAALKSWRQTALVAFGLPFAMAGGVYGLWLRSLPLTMPAAIGFVTLAGLSILNGMVLITYFNELRLQQGLSRAQAALLSARTRLRPVLMTALVAGVGFLPMAVSTSQGAELQRPFATVVIFGILTSTALTLLIIPLLLAGAEAPDHATPPFVNREGEPEVGRDLPA